MELLIALVVLAGIAVGVGAYFVARPRRNRELPLEPPVRRPEGRDLPGVVVDTRDRPTTRTAEPVPIEDLRDDSALGAPSGPATPTESALDETPVEEEALPVPPRVRVRFLDRLGKARQLLGGYFGTILGRSSIDEESWDDLEEALLRADVGVATTQSLLGELRTRVKSEGISEPSELLELLKTDLKKRLAPGDRTLRFEPGVTNVWLFVGVNGVGKTTTIGKVGASEVRNGRKVVMAAGDTFRAAAAEQLGMWADRAGAAVVRGQDGGDPSSVIFDAIEKANAAGAELVLADTAGRLQTKTNLMDELRKIRRVADKASGTVTEVLLVLDATTGQNGLSQATQFKEAADLTGVVLTKLDGTAKGGIAFAIQTELGIPIKLVGLGEGVDDLVSFDPDEYVDALFEK